MENFSQPLQIFYENVSNYSSHNFYTTNFSIDNYQIEPSRHDNSTPSDFRSALNLTVTDNCFTYSNVCNESETNGDVTKEKIDSEQQQYYLLLDFIVQGIILTLTCILGAIGNTWSVIIFTRMRRKSSFTAFLIGLSFCDAVLVYTSILLFGLPAIFHYLQIGQWYIDIFPFIVVYIYPVSSSAQTGSVYFTVGITIERYFAVCKPLQSRCSNFLATWKRGALLALCLVLFSVVFNIPRWWEYEVRTSARNNATTRNYCVTSLREHPKYIKYYINYAYLIVMFALPIIVLVVFNSVIYSQIQVNNRLRQRLATAQSTENSLALILICVVVVFLLCDVLPLVNNIMEHYFGYVYNPLIYVGNFLVAFNSSANFFIYYVCGKNFRQYFWKSVKSFLCCCLSTEHSDNSSSVYYGGEMTNMTNFRASSAAAERRQTFPIVSPMPGIQQYSNGHVSRGSICKGGNSDGGFSASRRQAIKMNEKPQRQRASVH